SALFFFDSVSFFFFFFFQAEDGIRDDLVTGVQTCALPISFRGRYCRLCRAAGEGPRAFCTGRGLSGTGGREGNSRGLPSRSSPRSEERRVGKENRSGEARGQRKKKRGMRGQRRAPRRG